MCHVLQVVAQAVDHLGPLRSENEIQYLTPQVFYTAQEGGMIKFFFFYGGQIYLSKLLFPKCVR